ncbi:tRNA (adenosine(37)-N6)-threonylcarbamoyltransferase complex ATPase subunit type 1 TsaE [Paenibacillus thalictri]|uniref:tRNA threonylcarbamoyladenosine biosynthesis protein TsaE n=1 Tax=Paenibacillus thalictri TaxID=2527873 RepID=A0A4Q9DU02_9BACL|nr:tRNA (adenosine(37)-N6)-threonylcarbamoyltransferase complex ATPase subunit type 1 TsaE [Paenibacillus thalictri]TBL78697.1 tRNA (adenosine(37)-N6)-threonylcarbamoyltransferase complex ATPase subunit type 1 TsaE [Paenibacillus thalictri]
MKHVAESQSTYLYEAHSEAETEQLAAHLAPHCQAGAVITLDGDLGAGKTRFSRAMAQSLGVRDNVNSPTFTIIKEYEGTEFPFFHMDVYRLSLHEAGELGLDEYFYGAGVTLIEWSELVEELLPADRLAIRIEYAGEQDRQFHLTPYGEPYGRWCRELKENGILI